ncbi:expressed unknown protein [Seminavis robusta]|uniref:J domain-containing protein n=1 Tax=Seminavis robusta TaxID=568900 RepID=A0A9N8HI41_9STRA|nr:expressed unknown protein [Seminavis robusta]|eukprot:Sro570_g168550.1 n/a (213) ;mRNA; f:45535-46173
MALYYTARHGSQRLLRGNKLTFAMGSFWRPFSSNTRSGQRIRHQDPFKVLGLQKGATYHSVKEAFLKLALEHHPDRQKQPSDPTDDDKSQTASSDNAASFIRIRQAFEVIREGSDGQAEAADESQWSEEELRDFMEEQTSEFLTFRMDHDTRKEVIAALDLSAGGLDRGGTWMMARMLAEREKSQQQQPTGPPTKELSAVADSQRIKRRRRR